VTETHLTLIKSGEKTQERGEDARMRCPKCGVVTYSITLNVAPERTKKGARNKKGKSTEACLVCFQSGSIKVLL